MYKNITLTELIKELQRIEKEYGDREIESIGSCSGRFEDMKNPYNIRLSRKNDRGIRVYVAGLKEDIGKSYAEDAVF